MKFIQNAINNIPVINIDRWEVKHGFLGRDVNLRFSSHDWSKVSEKKLYLLEQVHGVDIVDFDMIQNYTTPLKADAWIGSIENLLKQDIALGIKTADCAPVLILGEKNFAALHCGWRSTYAGLLEYSLSSLLARDEDISNIRVAIGPAAQICCYEVSLELRDKFEKKADSFSAKSAIISNLSAEKTFLSVSGYLYNQARELGVNKSNIIASEECTICEKKYFSHRREKDDSGRQVSFFLA